LGEPEQGVLITFEGIDGCGKSTQLELLAADLESLGLEVVRTREPGGTRLGEAIREALLDARNDGMSPRAEALLYAAARAQLVEEVIRPALAAGRVVLSDRYIDSSLAYQGFGRELGHDDVILLSAWATDHLFPDLTLLLTVTPEVRRTRMKRVSDRLESGGEEFFHKVEEGYRRLAHDHRHRIRVVDANAGIEQVYEHVRREVDAALGLFGG
jgi:dTMP kinase